MHSMSLVLLQEHRYKYNLFPTNEEISLGRTAKHLYMF